MKLAVIFLCLSVASLFGTSKGQGAAVFSEIAGPIDKHHLSAWGMGLYHIGYFCSQKQNGYGCDWDGIICGCISNLMTLVCKDCGWELGAMYTALGCNPEQITAFMARDYGAHLNFIFNGFLQNLVCCMQVLFGGCGCSLWHELEALCKNLGVNVTIVVGSLPGLETSITEVTGNLTTPALDLLNSVTFTSVRPHQLGGIGDVIESLINSTGNALEGLGDAIGNIFAHRL